MQCLLKSCLAFRHGRYYLQASLRRYKRLATSRLYHWRLGEGFDDPCLDTLFLAMPISWHGTLAQYAGRLHRLHHAKKEVIIYDYVDRQIHMLARMAEKRMKGYTRLGYANKQSPVETFNEQH